MLTFSVDGVKYEFEDKRLMRLEAIAVKTYTGLTVKEFWEALSEVDPDALGALYWLALKRAGREDIPRFPELDFDLMELMTTLESDEEPDAESDPTEDSTPKPEAT